MVLPAGLKAMGSFKGAKGDTGTKGDTGSLAFATAETVPWTEGARVEMVGPDSARGAHFKIPLPLPGPETVNNDDATEQLVLNPTKTSAALNSLIRPIATNTAEAAAAVAARSPYRAQGGSRLPASAGVMTVPPGLLVGDSLMLRPYEPQRRSGRYINRGTNPFLVKYMGGELNFERPTVPFGPALTIAPGQEWVEVDETRALWVISELGTTIEFFVQMGADVVH